MAALLVANTLLWPTARFLNDKFVPEQHRVTANHIMTVSPSALGLVKYRPGGTLASAAILMLTCLTRCHSLDA